MNDKIEKLLHSTIQHGKENNRIYLMKLSEYDMPKIIDELNALAKKNQYGKIFAKVPEWAIEEFSVNGFTEEANIPGFYSGIDEVAFMAQYPNAKRQQLAPDIQNEIKNNLDIALQKPTISIIDHPEDTVFRKLNPEDTVELAEVYKQVFKSYPFPIFDPDYLKETMESHIVYFGAFHQGKMVAAASSEMDKSGQNAEMTDFATLPAFRGKKLALILLNLMETEMAAQNMKTLYTIARAHSAGMNITFAKAGYEFCGTLVNNTNIFGRIESMNVWYKPI